jgi:hypothetical protein
MDILITAIGLIVAVFAVLPRERRLEIRLRLGLSDAVAFGAGAALVGYLDLYSYFKVHHLAPKPPPWTTGLTPAQLEHVVLISMLLALAVRWHFARLSTRRISKFEELADELLWTESYAELLLLLQTHLREFFSIHNGNLWPIRLRERWLPSFQLETLVRALARKKQRIEAHPHSLVRLIRPMISRLPEYQSERAIAANTARKVLLTSGFVAALVRARPYLAIDIIQQLQVPGSGFFRESFVQLYFDELLSHKPSILYSELANNRNSAGRYRHRYEIPRSNKLIQFLFSSAETGKDLEVWRPVGEFMLRELDRLAHEPESDPYNHAYTEEMSWQQQSPLFAGVQFFEIMVSEALFQGIEWHMWLYYTTYLVKKIVRNYQPADDPLIVANAQFQIWYDRLLYDIFSALHDWALAVQDVPPNQTNVRLSSTHAIHDNGNIPKSSILALGTCLHTVLSSDKLTGNLSESLVNLVLHAYFELRGTPEGDRYAATLADSILWGGIRTGALWSGTYRDRVRAAIQRQDRIRYSQYMSDLDSLLP